MPIEDIARVVHEANRAYNVTVDDPAPDGPWDTLPGWHQESICHRVKLMIDGYGPAVIHQAWVDEMLARGWQPGDVKDPAASPPVHTCLRPWSELPDWQQRKDVLAKAIAVTLSEAVPLE